MITPHLKEIRADLELEQEEGEEEDRELALLSMFSGGTSLMIL